MDSNPSGATVAPPDPVAGTPIPPNIDTFVSDGTSLMIGGKSRKMRRMGLVDLFRAMQVVRDVMARGSIDIRMYMADLSLGPDALQVIITMGLCGAEDSALEFLASLFDVTVEEIRDPNQFPLADMPTMVRAFVTSPDVKAFFSGLGEMMKDMTPLMAILSPPDGGTPGDTTST